MSDTTTSPCSSPTLSKKSTLKNYLQKTKKESKNHSFDILSPTVRLHPVQKRQDTESLIEYIKQVASKIYESDPLTFKIRLHDFLNSKLPECKLKILQRLSYIHYLQQSLKYKPLSEIDVEIQDQWEKKNILFKCLISIWGHLMLLHPFQNQTQFLTEYNKQRNFVANVTNHFFHSVLVIHEAKAEVFEFIYDDCAHHIINSSKEWNNIYHLKLLPLLKTPKNTVDEHTIFQQFNFAALEINRQYLDIEDDFNQLSYTTYKIESFCKEYRIHQRIDLLRQIRASFIKEIESNRQRIAQMHESERISSLQKDDIIGCMIYCIIKGQLRQLQQALTAFSLLLGNSNHLLSKKAVDSYRADLQSAVQHLYRTLPYQPSHLQTFQTLRTYIQ